MCPRYTPVLRVGFFLWTVGAGLNLLFNQNTSTAVYVVVLSIEGAGVGWVHQPGTYALRNEAYRQMLKDCRPCRIASKLEAQ